MIPKLQIEYQAVEPTDLEFLLRVYVSTRIEEMAITRWPDSKIQPFLRSQFLAQHAYYQEKFKGAHFQIILVNKIPAGRLYWNQSTDEFHVIDIALLPEFRGRGIGGSVMKFILEEAEKSRLATRIHVELNNPAIRLYQRLGFTPLQVDGIYQLMEHLPMQRKPIFQNA